MYYLLIRLPFFVAVLAYRNTFRSLVIVGVDDNVDDGNVKYKIHVSTMSKDPNYNQTQRSIEVINLDNDAFGFSVSDSVFDVKECDVAGCGDDSLPASTMISLDSL